MCSWSGSGASDQMDAQPKTGWPSRAGRARPLPPETLITNDASSRRLMPPRRRLHLRTGTCRRLFESGKLTWRESRAAWAIVDLLHDNAGYSNHPENRRWVGCSRGWAERNAQLVAEWPFAAIAIGRRLKLGRSARWPRCSDAATE